MTTNCSLPWGPFQGEIPKALLHFYIFYCCAIFIVGTLCNVLALWCVVRCPRTILPAKVVLCALFSTTLLMCLLVMPFMAHLSFEKLWCDEEAVKHSKHYVRLVLFSTICLSQMEIFYIFSMAFLRARAVWLPQWGPVKLRTAVAMVVGIGVYNIVMAGLVAGHWEYKKDHENHSRKGLRVALSTLHYALPALLTLAVYLSTIVAVRYSNRNLAASQQGGTETQVMDEATRAMVAVFILNLIFCLQHALAHIKPFDGKILLYVVIHSVFFTHLFVDPLVFVYLNKRHRHHVLQTLKLCLGRSAGEDVVSTTSVPVTQSTSVQPFRGGASQSFI